MVERGRTASPCDACKKLVGMFEVILVGWSAVWTELRRFSMSGLRVTRPTSFKFPRTPLPDNDTSKSDVRIIGNDV